MQSALTSVHIASHTMQSETQYPVHFLSFVCPCHAANSECASCSVDASMLDGGPIIPLGTWVVTPALH